jgi:hypothetical protein
LSYTRDSYIPKSSIYIWYILCIYYLTGISLVTRAWYITGVYHVYFAMIWLLDPQLNLPVELRARQHTARRVCTVESTQIYLFQAVLAADPLLLHCRQPGSGWRVWGGLAGAASPAASEGGGPPAGTTRGGTSRRCYQGLVEVLWKLNGGSGWDRWRLDVSECCCNAKSQVLLKIMMFCVEAMFERHLKRPSLLERLLLMNLTIDICQG